MQTLTWQDNNDTGRLAICTSHIETRTRYTHMRCKLLDYLYQQGYTHHPRELISKLELMVGIDTREPRLYALRLTSNWRTTLLPLSSEVLETLGSDLLTCPNKHACSKHLDLCLLRKYTQRVHRLQRCLTNEGYVWQLATPNLETTQLDCLAQWNFETSTYEWYNTSSDLHVLATVVSSCAAYESMQCI